MKVLNSRSEVEIYIYPSTFISAPDLILKEFVIWLCEKVNELMVTKRLRIIFYLKWKDNSEGKKDLSQTPLSQPLLEQRFKNNHVKQTKKQSHIPESKFCVEYESKLRLN